MTATEHNADRLFDILRSETYWTAGIFNSWTEGRGAKAFRNCSIKSVDGEFRSKAEAMRAAEKAIKDRMLPGVRWDSAEPTASFCIPQTTKQKIGEIMLHARKDYQRIQDPGLENPDLVPNGAMPIAAEEPVFLLRASDVTAAQTVRYWARLNDEIRGDQNAIKLALDHAAKMDVWPRKKVADV